MKVVIDLDKLRETGVINAEEYNKLNQHALQETGSLAFNILVSLSVIAVAGSVIALITVPWTVIVLGMIMGAAGLSPLRSSVKWNLLSHVCVLIGSLLLCGGILWLLHATMASWIVVTCLLAVSAVLANSGLLVTLSVFSLSATIGAGAFYEHATYDVLVEQPVLFIVLFSLLSYATYRLSFVLPAEKNRLSIIASRASLFVTHLAFWVGSLWGDKITDNLIIPDWVFALVWAVLLLVVGAWAAKVNRRWVVNMCAVFIFINFYTQWFEYLGATPATVLVAGLVALVAALVIRRLNA